MRNVLLLQSTLYTLQSTPSGKESGVIATIAVQDTLYRHAKASRTQQHTYAVEEAY